jgi:membrane protein implicated in regulation of membrane protease activity
MTPAIIFLIIAAILIGTELLIMQFSVFWLMFFGLGALLTSAVCWLMPDLSMAAAVSVFFVSSVVVSGVLYPMLKKWQNKPAPLAGNDAIGKSAIVVGSIPAGGTGKVSWSGVDWSAENAEPSHAFDAGDTVTIQKLEGIRLIVGR